MTVSIEMLPAEHGDCLFVEVITHASTFTMIIDGGTRGTYGRALRKRLAEVKKLDVMVLTHVDYDHIGGFISLFKDKLRPNFEIGRVYINTPSIINLMESAGNVSIINGISFEEMLINNKIRYESVTTATKCINLTSDISLDILSPDISTLKSFFADWEVEKLSRSANSRVCKQEVDTFETLENLSKKANKYKTIEKDLVNASSIAFILNAQDKKILFLGDSHPQVILENLKNLLNSYTKLNLDCVKLSHHGSITSISKELIELLTCSKFLISTNGGAFDHKHPSRECLAKLALLCDRGGNEYINFYLNYPLESIQSRNGVILTENELDDYKINLEYRRVIEFVDY